MIRAGGSTIIVSRQSSGTNSVNYVTSDHLGSSSAITNSAGGILVNSSFDAFGKRRGSNWSGNPSAGDWTAIASTTRRGYTEHTMLDNLNLIHMNGRVQDPVLGRFASADPFITAPMNTQNYNRYAYVGNNPLTFVDPSGFSEKRVKPPNCIDGCRARGGTSVASGAGSAGGPGAGGLPADSNAGNAPVIGSGGHGRGGPPRPDPEEDGEDEEESECTIPDYLKDIWNLFKKDVLFEHVIQFDPISAEIVWGLDTYDRMAINVGFNTLGQGIVTLEDAHNMQGQGAIAAGSLGYTLSHSRGATTSGHNPTYHREVAYAGGRAGGSLSYTTSSQGVSGEVPSPPEPGAKGPRGRTNARSSRSLGFGAAGFKGEQDQYVAASPPWFDEPEFTGKCP